MLMAKSCGDRYGSIMALLVLLEELGEQVSPDDLEEKERRLE
jgi:hypothetical protein